MAIYHCSVKVISRSSGRSAVGASAYRSGEKLYNERDGLTHDYTRKTGIEHTEIMAPENSPDWTKNRESLWNKVESSEKRKDSQLAREVEVALPDELSVDGRVQLVRDYVKENFTDKGMVADISIHNKNDGNPHAHILLSMRKIENNEFGKKEREWNSKEHIEQWRENWSKQANKYLELEGHQERIDHRSYIERGIEKTPTIHEGHIVRAMESRGIETEVGSRNRQITEQNKMVELIDKQISIHERSLENERSTIYGTGNQVDGNKRNLTEIFLNTNTDRPSADISRASVLIQQGEHGIRATDFRSENTRGEIHTSTSQPITEHAKVERDSNGLEKDDNRLEREQQSDIDSNQRSLNQANRNSKQNLSADDQFDNRPFGAGEINSDPDMERQGEAIHDTTSDNDRNDDRDTGSISTGNVVGDIIKGVEKGSLENQLEQAQAERQRKQLSRGRTRTRGREIDEQEL